MPSGPFRRVTSKTIVNNPVASADTATVTARITGLSGLLTYGIALAYLPVSRRRPSSFAGQSFALYQVGESEGGEKVQLSSVPINGAAGQDAPDAWEITTTLAEIQLVFYCPGMGAGDEGRWEVIVTAVPAIDMCDSDFQRLAGQLDISVTAVTLA